MVSYRVSRIKHVCRLSPISTDIMASFDARSTGLSAMLVVFIVGRIVIDAAEKSIRNERKNDVKRLFEQPDESSNDED